MFQRGMHQGLILAAFTAILVTSVQAGPGTVIINEDFEDGKVDGFTEVAASDSRTGITTGDSFPVGNKAFTIYYPTDESWAYLMRYPDQYETIEISFAQKLPDGIPITNGELGWAEIKQSRCFDPRGVPEFAFYHQLQYYRPGFFGEGSAPLWRQSLYAAHDQNEYFVDLQAAELTKWHTQRYWLRMNSPGKRDGKLKYWFNNELRLDVTEMSITPDLESRPTGFYVGGNFSYSGGRPDFAFRRLIDNVRVVINGDAPGSTNELTISPIPNQSINEDTATPVVAFSVTRSGSTLGPVRVTATSSNPALIPTGNIRFTGSGANWTIKAAPVANRSGTATLRVQADDGMGTATAAFDVTVKTVADTPTVTGTIVVRNQLSWFGLSARRSWLDGPEVTHFKVTDIKNGALYHKDGRTMITSGQFITAAQGLNGLRFRPTTGFTGTTSFQVRAATSATDAGLGGAAATASILVTR